MPETITERFDVPLPLDALFAELERRFGPQARAELAAYYETANQRYNRAGRILQFEADLARHPEPGGSMDERKFAYRKQVVADPQAYIDGHIQPLEGRKPATGQLEITIQEAAELLTINRSSAWRIIKNRGIPHRYVTPRKIMVDRAAVERLAEWEHRRGRPIGRGDSRLRRRADG